MSSALIRRRVASPTGVSFLLLCLSFHFFRAPSVFVSLLTPVSLEQEISLSAPSVTQASLWTR